MAVLVQQDGHKTMAEFDFNSEGSDFGYDNTGREQASGNNNAYTNQGYMSPRGNYKGDPDNDETVKDWVGRLLLMVIPVVNIIMLIVWATDKSGTHRPRKAFAKAELIFCVIGMVLGACIGASASILLHNAKSKLTDAYYDSNSDNSGYSDSDYSDDSSSDSDTGYSDSSDNLEYSDEDNSEYSDENNGTDEGYDSSSSNSSDDEW